MALISLAEQFNNEHGRLATGRQELSAYSRQLKKRGITIIKQYMSDIKSSRAMINTDQLQSINSTRPTIETGAINELRTVINTLNVVVERLDDLERENQELRAQLARVSVKARRAMLVHGD